MSDMEIELKQYLEAGPSVAPKDALEFAEGTETKIVDLKFVDLLGRWQHVSLSLKAFDESAFTEGLGFDGSSIRGWQAIDKSDMLLVPDPASAILDPFTAVPTLSLICDIRDPITGGPYDKDPRFVARRAEEYLRSTGVADTAYIGPECEFFLFDSVSYDLEPQRTGYSIDSEEAHWNSGKPGLGYQIREKEGYFPPAPHDTQQDIRSEMVLTLEALGISCEYHHHEVATAGQAEIDMRFESLLKMADQVMIYKYVVKNVARRAGKTATFMPKPLFGDNGSGMHVHQSLWKEGTPLFADKSGYAGLSQLARSYVGGLLKHAPALLAFCAPTTNSYRRLVPGYEAPVNLVYSQRNRSACIRVPMYSESPKAKRLEFRPPDASANPYLAFSAMLMAGLDGIEKGMDAGEPADFDLFEEATDIPQVPGSLAEALDALETDHEFLLEGGVFSEDLIRTWIDWKREHEVDFVRLRPHPAEFALYYDAQVRRKTAVPGEPPGSPGGSKRRRWMEMIKVEAVVIRDRVETVIDAVEAETGHVGVTVVEAIGHGRQRGIAHEYRGRVFESRFLPKALLTFIVPKGQAEAVVEAISDAARSGNESGDGLVWTSPVYDVWHNRTGKPLHEYVEVNV